MCNAWNHSLSCQCGWGGDGHLGRTHDSQRRGRSFAVVAVLRYRDLLDAYTKANAQCPVCNAPVYFYQSDRGGRVFFDELGPPWPKHPCTDTTATRTAETVAAFQSGTWQPLLIESFARTPTYVHCYAVSGHTTSGHIAFFIRSSRLNLRAPFFVYCRNDGTIRLSSVQPYMNGFATVELPAWRSLLRASRAPVDSWSREESVELQLFELLSRRSTGGEV